MVIKTNNKKQYISDIRKSLAIMGKGSFARLAAQNGKPVLFGYDDQQRKIGTAVYSANGVSRIPITPSGLMKYLYMRMSGTFTVAGGAADGVLVPEQPLSLIKEIALEIDGKRRKIIDGATLYYLNKYWYGAGDELTALSIPGVQAATPISAGFKYDMQIPMMNMDTAFLTMLDTTRHANSLYLLITWGNTTDLVRGGDRTLSFPTTPSIEIVSHEVLKPSRRDGAEFIYDESVIVNQPAAVNSQYEIQLTRGGLYRALLFKTSINKGLSTEALSDAVIADLSLKKNQGALGNLYLREKLPWYNIKSNNKVEFEIETIPTGYALVDFCNNGDLDAMLDTTSYDDFRCVSNVATVTGTTEIKVAQCAMIEI